MSNPLFTLQELVRVMQRTAGADYGNWGLLIEEGSNEVFFGPEGDGFKLVVPLFDVVECAAESYPNYGLDEIFFLFGIGEGGGYEWGLARRE